MPAREPSNSEIERRLVVSENEANGRYENIVAAILSVGVIVSSGRSTEPAEAIKVWGNMVQSLRRLPSTMNPPVV